MFHPEMLHINVLRLPSSSNILTSRPSYRAVTACYAQHGHTPMSIAAFAVEGRDMLYSTPPRDHRTSDWLRLCLVPRYGRRVDETYVNAPGHTSVQDGGRGIRDRGVNRRAGGVGRMEAEGAEAAGQDNAGNRDSEEGLSPRQGDGVS
ncbi:hypothetical protein BD310DRAFT_77738 [Dichomitus squalens]|uniref:Uncharacterized protein n=1 Tax=Dichomitus squalens TaxID=114155 RepID=A0A4Q9PJT2_9APHY|nr:hypothetical protein BD310DRAFT_77738 [Dichomitus squalens]